MSVNEKVFAKAIGFAIAKRRKALRLTQEKVAEYLDVGNEAVSRMERGTSLPTLKRLFQLARILKCSVDELLIETSYRVDDQSKKMDGILRKLSTKDREFLLDFAEKFASLRTSKRR